MNIFLMMCSFFVCHVFLLRRRVQDTCFESPIGPMRAPAPRPTKTRQQLRAHITRSPGRLALQDGKAPCGPSTEPKEADDKHHQQKQSYDGKAEPERCGAVRASRSNPSWRTVGPWDGGRTTCACLLLISSERSERHVLVCLAHLLVSSKANQSI